MAGTHGLSATPAGAPPPILFEEEDPARERPEWQHESASVFITQRGSFTLHSFVPEPDAPRARNDWENFISCVRSRDAASLNSPASEARLTCSALHLVDLSLRHGRGFAFDPVHETACGDEEISACLDQC